MAKPEPWTAEEIQTGRAAIEADPRPEYRAAGLRWLATMDQRDARIRELEAQVERQAAYCPHCLQRK